MTTLCNNKNNIWITLFKILIKQDHKFLFNVKLAQNNHFSFVKWDRKSQF